MNYFIKIASTETCVKDRPRSERRTYKKKASRALLHSLVSEVGGDNCVLFEDNHSVVVNGRQLFWSVSYSDPTLMAVVADSPIAIDIEQHKPRKWLPLSQLIWRHTPTSLNEFYRRWTLAESVAKLSSSGLNKAAFLATDAHLEENIEGLTLNDPLLASEAYIHWRSNRKLTVCIATTNPLHEQYIRRQLPYLLP